MSAPLIVTPLGGVGRFGRNCLVIELEAGPALIVDCGARFLSEEEGPGFDIGLPDVSAIAALGDRLLAYVVTHGHEDHIGGLPHACARNAKPILTTAYTARLVGRRFDRTGLKLPPIHATALGQSVSLGPYRVRFLAVSHSIPDATCVVIDTPHGRLVHSGDFRVDLDPVLGPPTDLPGLTAAGDEGVRLLLADSTGAHIEGDNAGEKSVYPALLRAVQAGRGRVAVALFASHIQRVALLGEVARETGRKLALLGRGLIEQHRIASELGLLGLDDVLVRDDHLKHLPRERQLWALTGSQGEAGSALFRLSRGEAPFDVEAGDRLVLSARTIPGNELKLARMLDPIAERGAEIIDGARAPHVSGHGNRGDLAALLAAVRPEHFVALHGDARHLLAHGDLVTRGGLAPARIHGLRDAARLFLDDSGVRLDDGPAAKEPFALGADVTEEPGYFVMARGRMKRAGVLLVVGGSDASLVSRALFPPLDGELRAALLRAAPDALARAGTDAEDDAVRELAQLFRRRGRAAPEIILVPW